MNNTELNQRVSALYTDREVIDWLIKYEHLEPPEFYESGMWDISLSSDEIQDARLRIGNYQLSKRGYGLDALPKIPFKDNVASRLRRKVGVRGYFGLNGSGKSYGAVYDLIPTLNGEKWRCNNPDHLHTKEGIYEGFIKILSTVPILDPRNNRPHPLYLPYDDHRRLLHAEHMVVFLDEIQGIASAHDSAIPLQVRNLFSQFRRRELMIVYTGIEWGKAVKDIRDITRLVIYCKGYIPIYEKGRVWPSNSWFIWRSYPAEDIDRFDAGTRKRLVAMSFQNHFRLKKSHHVQDLYDSFGVVLSAGGMNDTGMCLHCGGKRSVITCKCDRAVVDEPENLRRIGLEYAAHSHDETSNALPFDVLDAPQVSREEALPSRAPRGILPPKKIVGSSS